MIPTTQTTSTSTQWTSGSNSTTYQLGSNLWRTSGGSQTPTSSLKKSTEQAFNREYGTVSLE
ncbi:hypothetical protein LINPERPRIM_LOCUS27416 [Linum perenne]